MKKHIANALFALVALLLVLLGVRYYLDLPTVYESYSTQECVKVETPDGPGSCERLPKKYHHVWVQ